MIPAQSLQDAREKAGGILGRECHGRAPCPFARPCMGLSKSSACPCPDCRTGAVQFPADPPQLALPLPEMRHAETCL